MQLFFRKRNESIENVEINKEPQFRFASLFSSVKKNIICKTVDVAGRIVAYTMFSRFYIIYGACRASTKQQLKGWATLVWALQMETPLTFRTWIDQCLHVPSFLQVNLNSSNIMIDSVIHLCCKGSYRFKPQGSKTLSYSELSFFFQKKIK